MGVDSVSFMTSLADVSISSEATTLRSYANNIAQTDFLTSTHEESVASIEALAQLINAAHAALGRCSLRVEGIREYRDIGYTDAASLVAQATGSTHDEAASLMNVTRVIDSLPEAHRRYRNGELSPQQAREVARGATHDPFAEEDLLHLADFRPISDLVEHVDQLVAAHDAALVVAPWQEQLSEIEDSNVIPLRRGA